MTETKEQSSTETYDGPLSPAGVAALKFAVVGMGVLIVVGLVLVVGRIIYLASKPKADNRSQPSTLAAEATVSIPTNARPVRTSTDGSRLSILYRGPGEKFGVVIVDLTTGRTLSHVKIGANGSASDQKIK
ncbi:MAG: hypothetical protein AAGD43_15975 [Pseudomonadota bacterium]